MNAANTGFKSNHSPCYASSQAWTGTFVRLAVSAREG